MTLTYRKLSEFVNAASTWLAQNPSGHEKFSYALKKLVRQGREAFRRYEEQIEDIQITHSAVDDKGIIARDDKGNLQYTPEGLKARNAEMRAMQDIEVAFKPFIVADAHVPALDDDYRECFEGIVVAAGDGFKIVPHQVHESDHEMVYDILTDKTIKVGDRHIEAPEMVDA